MNERLSSSRSRLQAMADVVVPPEVTAEVTQILSNLVHTFRVILQDICNFDCDSKALRAALQDSDCLRMTEVGDEVDFVLAL